MPVRNAHGAMFRPPASQRYISLFGAIFLALVSALFVGFALILLLKKIWTLGLFIAAMAIFIASLAGYVMKDFFGQWGLRVELFDDRVTLDLPSGRSLIRRPPTQHLTVAYNDIIAIEARLEAFRTLGMAMIQRPYVLARKSGERILGFTRRRGSGEALMPRARRPQAKVDYRRSRR